MLTRPRPSDSGQLSVERGVRVGRSTPTCRVVALTPASTGAVLTRITRPGAIVLGHLAAWTTYCTASPRSPWPLRFPSDRRPRHCNVKLQVPAKPGLGWDHTCRSQPMLKKSEDCREAQVPNFDPQVLGSDPRVRTSRCLFRVEPCLARDHLGVMPHDPVQRPPGGSTATSVPELRASGGQVIGSTARDVRRSSGSRVSPV